MACKPEAQLNAALDRLLAAGLLFRQGEPPDATYLFKHALVQDAAHSTLLREPRRALHARIAETLESQFADIVERHPEILARHCTEAGLLEKAARLWSKAGQRSLDLVALAEAVAYLQEGLAIIERLPPSEDRDSLEIALREPLHSARLRWRGWASPEVRVNATAILQLTQRQSRPQSLVVGLWGMWINTITQGRIAEFLTGLHACLGKETGPGTSTCRSWGTAPACPPASTSVSSTRCWRSATRFSPSMICGEPRIGGS